MPSYHLGLSSLVRASSRTWLARLRTCTPAGTLSAGCSSLHRIRADQAAINQKAGTLTSRFQEASLEQGKQASKHGQKGACLGIGGGGVGDVGVGRLAVAAQALHQLGGVAVEVVRHVGQRDLAAVQVLECAVHGLHAPLERVPVAHAAQAGPAAAVLVKTMSPELQASSAQCQGLLAW